MIFGDGFEEGVATCIHRSKLVLVEGLEGTMRVYRWFWVLVLHVLHVFHVL